MEKRVAVREAEKFCGNPSLDICFHTFAIMICVCKYRVEEIQLLVRAFL